MEFHVAQLVEREQTSNLAAIRPEAGWKVKPNPAAMKISAMAPSMTVSM
ncbi:hypothetical protein ABZV14_20690 [Streptosporangium canum]